jgi:lysine 6-dehydrogenase
MKVFCLGGAGRICRETAYDLVHFSDFEKITIGDVSLKLAQEVADWLDDPRVDAAAIDVTNPNEAAKILADYDVVVDGTTIKLNRLSTECIAEAGVHGVNLNGFGEEFEFDDVFKAKGRVCVPGFGMTPGVTQMMAMHAANQLDTVDTIRVSHGAFRPIAFSASITETTVYEYDPNLPGRVVFEDGEFKQVPAFARPRDIALPEPYGTSPEYIIPHAEPVTLAQALKDKGVRLIECRGTWPQQNMRLVKALYEYGFMRNDKITVNGAEVGIMDCVGQYLQQCPEGQETDLYGYALHVEVTGAHDGKAVTHTLYHTHPTSDGSIPEWAGLRAYTRNVGIPMAIAAELIAAGKVEKTGVLIPEDAFNPVDVFDALDKRSIHIHATIAEK